MFRSLFLCSVVVMFHYYFITTGALGSPILLTSFSTIKITLHLTIILIITLTSFYIYNTYSGSHEGTT